MKSSCVVPLLLLLAFPAATAAQENNDSSTTTASALSVDKTSPVEGAGSAGAVADDGQLALRERLARLEEQLAELQAVREEEELAALRQAAEAEAAAAPEPSEGLAERTYVTASRSLQMLNPELSLSADFVSQLVVDPELRFYAGAEDRSRLPLLRALDLHLQSSLDPFSLTKIAIGATEHGVHVEELYITWTGVIPRATLSVGLMRQQLGVVNRWHTHDLDQVDYPLPITLLLGEEGLVQSGVSLSWLLPALLPLTNELTLQLFNGQNEAAFSGELFSVPTLLGHVKNYLDLTEDLYLELGLSGMWGINNQRGLNDAAGDLYDEPWRSTWIGGADLTLVWEPLRQARYWSITWRSEGLWVSREDEPAGASYRHAWGAYTYLQAQLFEVWFAGLRGDVVQPLGDLSNQLRWQVAPYVTFWQSEFVYLRLQARHGLVFDGVQDTRVMLQLDWAAGPHKHEKY